MSPVEKAGEGGLPGRVGGSMERWLREQAGPYEERERVCVDVETALARFPALRPKSDVYSMFTPFFPLFHY